jgi:hypothetical protein
MTRWPYVFFATATVYILIGVFWGMAMSLTHHHETYSAHAHLNLIGWVSQGLMGLFYAVMGRRTPNWLMATNYVFTNIGVICMTTVLYLYLSGSGASKQLMMGLYMVGPPSVILGFLFFAGSVFLALARNWKAPAGVVA